jgi:hypothetical protein
MTFSLADLTGMEDRITQQIQKTLEGAQSLS